MVYLKDYHELWLDLTENLKIAYTSLLGNIDMTQIVQGAATITGMPAGEYFIVGTPVPALSTCSSMNFLVDNFGTLKEGTSVVPHQEEYYTSPWANPARIMLINFGALALGGILAKRR